MKSVKAFEHLNTHYTIEGLNMSFHIDKNQHGWTYTFLDGSKLVLRKGTLRAISPDGVVIYERVPIIRIPSQDLGQS